MRRKIAAGNWKMNTDISFGLDFLKKLNAKEQNPDVEVILGVPFISLLSMVKEAGIASIAAQNCHQELSGAYTGETSVEMLSSINVPYVILGHSERREYFNETDKLILAKMQRALEAKINIIYCCGEPLEIREEGTHEAYVGNQLSESVCYLEPDQMKNVIVAYEPIWAIGTGKTATSEQAQNMHAYIRTVIAAKFGKEIAAEVPILYGGSVKPANAKDIFSQADVDGGLVGGASLDSDSFHQIIQSF